MAYSKTEQMVWKLAEPVIQEQNCYLYDVEYVKEGGIWYLRVLADKEDGGITLDECEAISRRLSDVLDREDPIGRNYYLEVASPGVERKLKTLAHFARYQGRTVDVGLYRPMDGVKQLTGILEDFDGETMTIRVGERRYAILQSDTAVVNLHFEF